MAKRFVEDEYELMPLARVPKNEVPPRQDVAMDGEKNDTEATSTSTDTSAGNNSKKRRTSNQNGVISSSTLSSRPSSREKKRIKVAVSPSFLLPQEFTDASLTATVENSSHPRMKQYTSLPSRDSTDSILTSPTLVDAPLDPNEVRIFLTPCLSVSQPLSDHPLYAIVPKDNKKKDETKKRWTGSKKNMETSAVALLAAKYLVKENSVSAKEHSPVVESKETFVAASKVTPTPDNSKKRKSDDDESPVSALTPRDMWPQKVNSHTTKNLESKDMLPPCPDTPLARQNSLQVSNALVPSVEDNVRKIPDDVPSSSKVNAGHSVTSTPLTRQTTPSAVDTKRPVVIMSTPLTNQTTTVETPVSRTAATPVMSNLSVMAATKTPLEPPLFVPATGPNSHLLVPKETPSTSVQQPSKGGLPLLPGISRTLSRSGSMTGQVGERKKLKRIVCKFYSYLLVSTPGLRIIMLD